MNAKDASVVYRTALAVPCPACRAESDSWCPRSPGASWSICPARITLGQEHDLLIVERRRLAMIAIGLVEAINGWSDSLATLASERSPLGDPREFSPAQWARIDALRTLAGGDGVTALCSICGRKRITRPGFAIVATQEDECTPCQRIYLAPGDQLCKLSTLRELLPEIKEHIRELAK